MARRLVASFVALLAIAGMGLLGASPAQATGPAITVGALNATTSSTGNPVPITLSGFDSSLTYAAILSVSAGTLNTTTTSGLTVLTGYAPLGTASDAVGFSGAYADVESAVTSIVYSAPDSAQDVDLAVTVTEIDGSDPNIFFNPVNGHYYEAVNDESEVTWGDALAASAASSLYGLTGYLATLTSESENDFVTDKTTAANVWIGAARSNANDSGIFSDPTNINDPAGLVWEWKTGPEAGTDFLQQVAYNSVGGTAINGEFNSWANGEPNNYQYGLPPGWYEGFAVTNWDNSGPGQWNDLPNSALGSDVVYDYLIEYGGIGTSTASQAEASATISVGESTPTIGLTLDAQVGDKLSGAVSTISGSGLKPTSPFDLTMHSDPVVVSQGTTDSSGNFNEAVTIPAEACLAGVHEFVLTGIAPNDQVLTATKWIELATDCTILQISDTEITPTMPDTGTSVRNISLISASALALFAFAFVAIRSRRGLRFASVNDRVARALADLNAGLARLEAPRRRRIRKR